MKIDLVQGKYQSLQAKRWLGSLQLWVYLSPLPVWLFILHTCVSYYTWDLPVCIYIYWQASKDKDQGSI